ncbi:hypothetical protein BV25DRAFT_1735147 [Artomyces pyxidatus]|uniref:Uncharacterized protein n=1 Tax=Artomyces pyxidatus TaxID=48021 RepID=A0ACB8SH96_9AGAM|nr:hypothetical protein BV25DRAFT_1735147 [Artomyces pyxidatus]
MQLITVALSTLTLALGVSAAPVPNALEGSEINARSFIDVAKQFASPHIGPGPVVFNSSEIASTSQNSGISGTAIFTLPGHIPNPHIAPPIGIFAPPVKNLRSEEHARAIIEEYVFDSPN